MDVFLYRESKGSDPVVIRGWSIAPVHATIRERCVLYYFELRNSVRSVVAKGVTTSRARSFIIQSILLT